MNLKFLSRTKKPAQLPAGIQGDGAADLEKASGQDIGFNPEQPLGAELETDGEQEKDHPDLGHELDLMHIDDQAEPVGAGQGPGDQEPDNGRNPEPVEKIDYDQGKS